MEEILKNNEGIIVGHIMEDMSGYKVKDKTFYAGRLRVERPTKKIDYIPFTISENLVKESDLDLLTTQKVAFKGELHSQQKLVSHKLRFEYTFKVNSVEKVTDDKQNNNISLVGHLCRSPLFETTLSGNHLCRLLLAVPRGEDEQIDYIHLNLWNGRADFAESLDLKIGSQIRILGRIEKLNEDIFLKVSCGKIFADKTQDID